MELYIVNPKKFWLKFEEIKCILKKDIILKFRILPAESDVTCTDPPFSLELVGVSQHMHVHMPAFPEASTKCMRMNGANQNIQGCSENLKL